MKTLDEMKARCIVDAVTRCWNWQGACSKHGQPRVYAIDYEQRTMRTMNGPKAAWMLAHEKAPTPGYLVFRSCQNRKCLNPVHLSQAKSLQDIGAHIRRSGVRKPRSAAQIESSKRMARMYLCKHSSPTPDHVVAAIRAADPELTNFAVAALHGVKHWTVSRIRRGDRHGSEVAA